MGRVDKPDALQVFLAYGRADGAEAAARLEQELAEAAFTVWYDAGLARGGPAWKEQVRAALRDIDVVLVLLTPAAVESELVAWEWQTALKHEATVIPLLVAPCDIPPDLARLHRHDLSDPETYDLGLAALLSDLHTLGTARQLGQQLARHADDRARLGPYVVRGITPPQPAAGTPGDAHIRLLIERGSAAFEIATLISTLGELLGVDPAQVYVLSVQTPGARVDLQLPQAAANQLYVWAVERGLLWEEDAPQPEPVSDSSASSRTGLALPLPVVPQTDRSAPQLSRKAIARLLSVRHPEDMRDLFANDPDGDIRELGRIALRRKPPDLNDYFALGDLCAQRVLIDDQLRVFYAGKTLTAYQKAASRATLDMDRQMAEQASAQFIAWVAEIALRLPTPRNVAVALWVASDMPPQEQPEPLQDALHTLLRQYPVRPPVEAGGPGWHAPADDIRETLPDDTDPEATAYSVSPPAALRDTEDDLDAADVFSSAQDLPGVERGAAGSPVADQPDRAEGAFSAVDMAYGPSGGRSGATGTTATAQDEFWPGDRIENRYEVVQALRGGMGVVYLCYDHEERAPVAIKSFQSRFFNNEQAVKRFEQEALTWIRLEKHRHIVQARVVRTVRERPHLFLEHISGPEGLGSDLRAWIDHNRIGIAQAVTFALHIALGMQHAVQKVPGLVHRDLKPANILVTHEEVAKVTDFGLVRSVEVADVPLPGGDDDLLRLTRVGAIVGTAPYMSPEQCRAGDVDHRSDIYAFGCILYEMLAGRPVFKAQKFHGWLTAHLIDKPEIPPDVAVDLPPVLGELLLACLAKSPDDRPQTWGALVDQLAAIYADVVGEAPVLDLTGTQLQAHELMDKGYSLTELGRNDEALDAYDRALALQPNYAWAWARKGRTLRLLERYDEALDCFDRAIKLTPGYGWAWNGKGIVLERLNRPEEALAAYERAATLKPGDVWPWYNQADILQSLGRYTDALPLLDRALNADPMHAHSWAKRGQIYRLMERYESAAKAYRMALKLQPTYGWASNGLGLSLKALGRWQEALTAFRNAARDAPHEVWHWYNQVEMLVELGRYGEALSPAQQAVQVGPTHAFSWAKLGQVHRYLHQYEEAIAAYDQAITHSPEYGWAINGKGIVLERLERYVEALDCYKQAATVAPEDVWHWYNQGNVLVLLKQFEEALVPLQQAIDVSPNHARSWARIGNALRYLDRPEEALVYLEEAVNIDPNYAWAWNEIGVVLESLDRRQDAFVAYARAVDAEPGNTLYLYNQAEVLITMRRNEEAQEALALVVQHDPLHHRAWARLGQVLRRLRRYDEALAAYDRALEVDPRYAWGWNGRGLTLSAMGQHEQALAAFHRAAQEDSGDVWFWYNQGDALVALHRYQEALDPLDRALAIHKGHIESWAKRGQALRRLGRHKEAIAAYDQALAVDPHYAWAWNGRGLSLEGLGRREEALASYERAVKEDPNSLWYYTNQLDPLLALRRYDQALTVVDRALTVNEDNANVWARRGQILRRLRRPAEAIESYERAVKLDPEYAWAFNGMGLAYAALEQWEQALRSYERATHYNGNDVWFWYNQGEALVALARYEEAVESLNRALTLDPHHEPSRNKRTEARRLWQES